MTLKFYLGLLLELCAVLSIIWCITMVVVVFKLAFIKRKSPMYIFSAANVMGDIFTLFNYIVYLAPCIITDSFIIWGEKFHPLVVALAVEAAASWFVISFAHILVALNRLVVICFNNTKIFTYRVALLLTVVVLLTSSALAVYVELLAPCCMFLHDHEKMSFTYELKPGIPNYSNLYVHTPINITTSSFCAVCYVVIYIYIKKATSSASMTSKHTRRREYIYALQFCAISVFHLLIWVSLRVFPLFIDSSQSGASNWFIFTSFFQIFSSLAVTVVYTFFNSEVRALLLSRADSRAGSTIQSVPVTISNNY